MKPKASPSMRRTGLRAVRVARVGMARVRRAVARSPQSSFLRQLVAQPGSVGAICASSPRLAACMASHVDPTASGLVVELGGGTGAITAALLARGVAPERLVVIEQASALAAILARRFPQVRVIHGDAADLVRLHAQGLMPRGADGAALAIDYIVSGLPLLTIPRPIRERILQAGIQALAPTGRLLQFTYALRKASVWQSVGLTRLNGAHVIANLPPARVDVLGWV